MNKFSLAASFRTVLSLFSVLCPLARATTYSAAPSQSQSAIQAVINGTSVGDTVVFSSGTVLSSGTHPLTVTFSPADAGNYTSATATNSLIVEAAPAAATTTAPLIIWKTPAAIQYGTALSGTQLSATANVPGAFAYAPAAGTVLKAGTQTLSVTFMPADTKTYSTATASVKLVVNQAAPVIAWAPPTSITTGTALSAIQLNAKASVPGSFTYSPPLGTVLLTGTRSLRAAFVPSDAVDYMPVTANSAIAVEAEPSKIAPKVTWNTPSAVLYGTALSRTQLDATANAPGTFAYAPAAGTVLKAGTQLLSVSFTPTNTVAFSKTNASVLITVTKAVPVVTWPPLHNIAQGTPFGVTQLNAVANVQGTFFYSPGPGSVLPVGTRRLVATFSPNDAIDYAPVTANNSLTIDAASEPTTPAITWHVPAAITYGTPLGNTQLDAVANASGSFAFTPSAGTVLKTGRQTLNAVFTPSDTKTYSAATASVQLTVNPAAPIITWGTPKPITAGTALSGTQLSARASVPGSFRYRPAAGAVLAAGTHRLTVAFSPADASDYSAASVYTSLVVNASSSGTGGGPTNPAPTGCGGPTINLNNGMSQSALQSAISNAPNCSLILFAAGTYNITSALNLKCSLTYAGPVATPATAEITTSTPNIQLTTMFGGCTSGTTTIEYLHFNGAAPLYLDPSNYSNIVLEHNQITSLPAEESCGQACESLLFDGNNNNSYSNITVEYNTFGDSNSCTAGVNVDDGSCAGILVGPAAITNFIVKYNTFFHVLEGMHFYNVNYVVGNKTAQCDGCDIEFNYFNAIHRIALEFQTNVINHQAIMSNNVFGNPLNPYYNTLTVSAPCCQYSNTFGNASNVVPSNQLTNNVEINTLGSANSSPYGFEMAGNGTNANNNIIHGSFCHGFVWSFGANSWTIQNNTIKGAQMASGGTCPTSSIPSGFITSESGGTYAPIQSGNVTGATPASITSAVPAISPAGGTYTFPLAVTFTDPGYTSGSQPKGNTGIWYTIDGSTPIPGSGTAQYVATGGSISLASAATVKAVGMWGTPPQPTSYPAGYGFVHSGIVTAAYSVSGAIKQPAGGASSSNSPSGKLAVAVAAAAELPAGTASAALESVAINPSQPAVAIGSRTQLKAIATFRDGSVKDVTADFGWQSSDGRIMTANGSGALAGVASGKATISGSYRGLQASVPANSTIGEVGWSGPIVITEGGTYSGNWQSTDAKTAAVTVATTAPVIIENAHIRSVGDLIKTTVASSNLTVRNSLGVAVNAAVKGQPNGVFLEVASPTRLDVENNYIENAQGGVIVHGYAGNRDGGQTIVIRANRARNLNGLLSDGNGGYLQGEGADHSQARFIQFDSVQSVPGIDVGWNEVINYPGHSLVDDNIDVYRSSGTANQPIEIHDTYIQGAYPYKPAQDAYTGGGIKTEGRPDDSAQDAPAFNSIHDNQVVGTVNYGIEFAAGHDNIAANNRVISSGLLSDGTKIAAQGVGLVNGTTAGASASMYNNTMRGNLVGWTCWESSCAQTGYRKDQFLPASPADYSTNSLLASGQITFDIENNEYQVWLNKLSAAAVVLGPAF